VRWIGYLTLGLVFVASPAPATDRSVLGTLAREATPARPGRLAEIAKDARPPKPGGSSVPYDFRNDGRDGQDKRSRSPVIVFGRGRR
jgi:hypothetical protein